MDLLERTLISPVGLLAQRVADDPHGLAVVSVDGELTRAQLWEDSGIVAGALAGAGVELSGPVALLMESGVDLLRAIWGTLRTRSPYLPLSPEYPEERLRYMLDDSGAGVVLTHERLLDEAAAIVPPGMRVLTMEQVLAGDSLPVDVPREPAGHDVAYVIYTSGSTGRPKGVMIEHAAIAHQMAWIASAAVLPSDARILQKTPFSFDAAQWEILASAVGATVVASRPGLHRDPEELVAAVREYGVTALQCVPTMWRTLVQSGRLGTCSSLTDLYSGGELLTVALAQRLLEVLPGRELVNLYGPTEATINASAFRVTQDWLSRHEGGVPLGDPVAGMEMLVLDPLLRAVADGVPGELYLAGPQLARGYLGNDALTGERFPTWVTPQGRLQRLYRTGDHATVRSGDVVFAGRADHQVKISGHRIETDEVRLAVADHHWVREACVVPWSNSRTGVQQLAAFVELEPEEAALMDQGEASAHHQSKGSRVQVKAQLARHGRLDPEVVRGRPTTPLPGAAATAQQEELAFRRKTYRFFRGGAMDLPTVTTLVRQANLAPSASLCASGDEEPLGAATLGALLRWFGPFESRDRLLPKYAYASPGALAATQIHVEVSGVDGMDDGWHWFDPAAHHLVLLCPTPGREGKTEPPRVRIHLVGKRSAITAVYATNVDEVLHLEAGHMLGLLEDVAGRHGLQPHVARTAGAELPVDDGDLLAMLAVDLHPIRRVQGSSTVAAHDWAPAVSPSVTVLVQSQRGRVTGMEPGLHELTDGVLERSGADGVRRKDVIAINQEVFDRSSFGISLLAPRRDGWGAFVALGRALHRMQASGLGIGLMSSGYSSVTGRDLPSARRLDAVRGDTDHVSYFAVGGPLDPAQESSRGMEEDVVHMRGPAEILKDELKRLLPHYMLPARIEIVDSLPKTVNGKCDVAALRELAVAKDDARVICPPSTRTEQTVMQVWEALLDLHDLSVDDDFFTVGGNSLLGVAMVNRLNRRFDTALPLQTIFEAPTPRAFARRLAAAGSSASTSRFIPLAGVAEGHTVFCWPGLGGFPMNLRPLATALTSGTAGTDGTEGPGLRMVGIQAVGVNDGERPHPTIAEMAAVDVEEILARQPEGPLTLLGYSFGARVAYEAAAQLERRGRPVDSLVLVAPGSPTTTHTPRTEDTRQSFTSPYFVQILLSVFFGRLPDEDLLARCLREVVGAEDFGHFVVAHQPDLSLDLVRRITDVVHTTFEFRYTFGELEERTISAPVTLVRARGDDYSFIERRSGWSTCEPEVVDLEHDHYSILSGVGLDALAQAVAPALARTVATTDATTDRTTVPHHERSPMPHLTIKHFPVSLTRADRDALSRELSETIAKIFRCRPGVVSIALEAVEEGDWDPRVVQPEILGRRELLCKAPDYVPDLAH